MTDTGVFEQMLKLGKDNALLRFTLGSAFFKQERFAEAVEHLQKAVEFSPDYTAAWKILGRSLIGLERFMEAKNALQTGIEVADSKGDKQAAKEMQVFLKRVEKALEDS
ncbi:MAG: tetratricopeptide repeat protein [Gammaproteobacteria bacterium]|nr:tetratricopeptide repeat protein [Gammaproteobacteria bacterium]